MSGKLTRFQTSSKLNAEQQLDFSSVRGGLKPAAARDASPSSPTKSATPKLGQIGKATTVAGSTGFRRSGAAAGPSSSAYTQEDLDRNTTEGVLARQGLEMPTQQRPASLGLSKAAADEFVNAGTKLGIEIWRIEELVPVPWPEELYGKFCSGDSYILLHTQEVKGKMVYHIHFWLGTDSTVDETGAAAYKVVELTEKLGGEAPQHREVQDHEGALFLSYFPDGIEYLSGGVESAFLHVERDVFKTRLLHLKGKKQVRIKQVPLSYKSLNDGDVFVLDEGLKLYLWTGRGSSRLERTKGANVVQAIKDNERAGRAKIVILDQEDENEMMVQPDWVAFWEAMGGRGPVKSGDEEEDDAAAEKKLVADIKLFRVSDASGQLQISEVETRPLSRKLLDPMDAFILDCQTEIFAWVGKGATQLEKNEAVTYARKFLVKLNRPLWTPITRIMEGSETTVFKEKFTDWPDALDANRNFSKLALLTKMCAKADEEADGASKVDVKGLHRRATLASSNNRNTLLSLSQVVRLTFDDISGELKAWVIEGHSKLLLPTAEIGQLFEGNVYLLQYSYHPEVAKDDKQREHVVMTWMGRTASAWERELAVEQAKALAKELGGDTAVVNFVQGKEEEKFLDLFGGRMVVRRGERDARRRVAFRVHYTAGFAEVVNVCGNLPALGEWHLEKALALTPKEHDMHWGTLLLPQGASLLEYKVVITNEDKKKEPRWESGDNAKLQLKPAQQNTVVEIEFDQRDKTACVELPEAAKSSVALFHVKGTNALNTRAVQVPEQAASLNSGDAFVLLSPQHFYIWYGRGCNEGERKYSLTVANLLKPASFTPSIERIDESSEPEQFWTLLGGKGAYAANESLQAQQDLPPARLFHCSNASGKFTVDEIDPFSQDDLFEDDVMILDAFTEVYVWVGSGSNEMEKKRGYETARRYVRAAEDGRPANTPVLKVYAGDEPPSFVAHFHAWRKDHVDAYTQKLREMQLAEVDQVQRGKEKIQTTQEYTQEYEKARPKAIQNEDGTLSPAPAVEDDGPVRKASVSAIDNQLRESQGSPSLQRRETSLRLGAEKLKHQSQEDAAALRKQREVDREEREKANKETQRKEAEAAAAADKIRREAMRKEKEEREERERIQREKDEKERKERERIERAERARQEAIMAAQMEEARLARLAAAAKEREEEEANKAKAAAEEAAQRARESAAQAAPASSSSEVELTQAERMELLRKRREERLEAERLASELAQKGAVVATPEQVRQVTDVDHLAEKIRREKEAAAAEAKKEASEREAAEERARNEARTEAARAEAAERDRRLQEERAEREKREQVAQREREERAQRERAQREEQERKDREQRAQREEKERKEREERAERAKQEALLAARAAGEKVAEPKPAAAAAPVAVAAPRTAPTLAESAEPVTAANPALAAELKAAGVHRFYTWEELHSNGSLHRPPPDVDEKRLEAYLCDSEFKAIFKMTRQQFYAQKEWAIRTAKMKWKLW